MRLLIITQVVDTEDPVLGFFVRWIEEFAKHAESIEVICLKLGKSDFPENVRVHSLGKESEDDEVNPAHSSAKPPAPSSARRWRLRATYAFRFLSLAWRLRHDYDTVFVHMNPEYFVLAGKLWWLLRKRTALWYTHKSVDMKLRIAVLFANTVFTASTESFRLKSKKVQVVGHGIDMEQFAQVSRKTQSQNTAQVCVPMNILTIGRLSQTKRIMEMLAALDALSRQEQPFTFTIAGTPATEADKEYEKQVRSAVANSTYAISVHFLGALPHKDIPHILKENNIFINLSTTGSMDKAVLEALATGMPVVTTNEAFRDLLSPVPGLFITEPTPEKIINALALAVSADISEITKNVREHYALPHLIETICHTLEIQK